MAYVLPVVTKEENIWILRVQKPNGKTQEYRCATENQARQLAMLLSRPEETQPRAQV